MKMKKLLLAALTLIAGITSTQSAFAKLEGCASAANNVVANGGYCNFQYAWLGTYECMGASGTRFTLQDGNGPTGCDIVLSYYGN